MYNEKQSACSQGRVVNGRETGNRGVPPSAPDHHISHFFVIRPLPLDPTTTAELDRVVANPSSSNTSYVIVGDRNTVSVKNVIASRQYNVVGHRWILECIERGQYAFPSFPHVRQRDAILVLVVAVVFIPSQTLHEDRFARSVPARYLTLSNSSRPNR